MSNRNVLFGSASVALIVVLFLSSLWRAENQVRRHHRQLLAAIEDRDWDDIRELIADGYSDRWGHDKGFVIREASQVFRQFFAVKLTGEVEMIEMTENAGEIRSRLRLQGRGGPLAEFAITKVNALQDPWRFRWVKQSWKPWDWALMHVDQPELEIQLPSL